MQVCIHRHRCMTTLEHVRLNEIKQNEHFNCSRGHHTCYFFLFTWKFWSSFHKSLFNYSNSDLSMCTKSSLLQRANNLSRTVHCLCFNSRISASNCFSNSMEINARMMTVCANNWRLTIASLFLCVWLMWINWNVACDRENKIRCVLFIIQLVIGFSWKAKFIDLSLFYDRIINSFD